MAGLIHDHLYRCTAGATCGDDQKRVLVRLRNFVIVVTGAQLQVELVVDFGQVNGFGEIAILYLMKQFALANLRQVHERFRGSRTLRGSEVEW